MNKSVPYPPSDRDCIIVFREPFSRIKMEPNKKLYIRAIIDNEPEQEIRMVSKQQVDFIEKLIKEDGKILNAKVNSIKGMFELIERSPQEDFFDLVKGG